jgi:hypothetical protein
MTFSEKAYRLLLLAYPRDYRAQYAEPMEQFFRDRLREPHTFARLVDLWARTLADWAVSVPARHWEQARPQRHFALAQDPFRRCIFFACYEATMFSRREITLEHLLLGILRQDPSLVPEMKREAMVRAIERNEPRTRRRFARTRDLRLSRETARVATAAKEIAHAEGRQQIAPRDLAAGILREQDTLAARLLREHTAG